MQWRQVWMGLVCAWATGSAMAAQPAPMVLQQVGPHTFYVQGLAALATTNPALLMKFWLSVLPSAAKPCT